MDKFTFKQVMVLILLIIIGIAFLETSSPIWTSLFWREFILNILVYGLFSEMVVIGFQSFISDKK